MKENMIWVPGGLLVFTLYIMYDINSIFWKRKLMKSFFFLGNVLLVGMTVAQVLAAVPQIKPDMDFWIFIILSCIFLLVLIDTLFFELPFEATYLKPDKKPHVYNGGMYALCRHPGVLWFFLFYLCLGLALYPAELLYMGLFYSILNLCYVIFQDYWTFPRFFADYNKYKKTTPFLIPSVNSIRRAFWTRRSKQSK